MTLILTKDEPLNLSKNSPLSTKLTIGAGWGFNSDKNIDLDLFAYTNTKDVVYFNNKDLFNGAIICGPDNRDGKGQGIDETIDIDLTKMPNNITSITIALSSYSGESFDEVKEEFVQIADALTGTIIAKTEGEIVGDGKTLVFITLQYKNNEWVCTTKLEYSQKDFKEFIKSI